MFRQLSPLRTMCLFHNEIRTVFGVLTRTYFLGDMDLQLTLERQGTLKDTRSDNLTDNVVPKLIWSLTVSE